MIKFSWIFKILITNTIACKMLGYSSEELLSIKFKDLIAKEKFVLALPDMMFNEKGEIVVFNGKVVSYQVCIYIPTL